jgi:predicted TIM-barrel fold metal-dependent hydrolase
MPIFKSACWSAHCSNKAVKGFRRVLHVMPDQLSTTALFRDNVKRLSKTSLPFDLCVLPHQIPLAIALADHAPDVQFVLDHCGVPASRTRHSSPGQTTSAKLPNARMWL